MQYSSTPSLYILNSIATEDQKSLTKFENLEDGGIKHNLKRSKYGTITMQTFRNECGFAVYKSHYSSIVQFEIFSNVAIDCNKIKFHISTG